MSDLPVGDIVGGIESVNSISDSVQAAEAVSNVESASEAAKAAGEISEDDFIKAIGEQATSTEDDALTMMNNHSQSIEGDLSETDKKSFEDEINNLDEEIRNTTRDFKEGIEGEQENNNVVNPETINGEELEKRKSLTAKEMSMEGKGENTPIIEKQEEINVEKGTEQNNDSEQVEKIPEENIGINVEGKWYRFDPKTKEFVEEMDFDPSYHMNEDFTDEEWEEINNKYDFERRYQEYREAWRQQQEEAQRAQGKPPEIKVAPTESAKSEEDKEARELMKLLLRVAVKVSFKTAAILAKELQKSFTSSNEKELAFMCGVIGGFATEGEKLADTMIAGKKGTSVGEAIVAYFNKPKAQKTETDTI